MQALKAVLFDIDGTLLDTSEFIFQAYEHTMDTYGLPRQNRATIARLIGVSLEAVYRVLTPDEDIQALMDTHRAFQLENLHLSKPFPGTKKTLETLHGAGLRIATVTTRSKATAETTLELAGIADYIECTIAFEDVTRLKPDPEPVFMALDRLDIASSESAMCGDSDVDVLAGRNAGTITIAATYGFHGPRITECDPDFVIDSIEEIVPLLLSAWKISDQAPIIN